MGASALRAILRRVRVCRMRVRYPSVLRLQTELLGKLFLHFILIKDVGEDDLLVL